MYDVHNSNDLEDTLNNMAAEIELQIELTQRRKPTIRLQGTDKFLFSTTDVILHTAVLS